MRRGVYRNYSNGHMEKSRGSLEEGGEVGLAGVGWGDEEKMQTIVTE